MSSHHIVRDKQEPALIIADGEECSFDLLGQLLEWSPFIVVLDGAIIRVLELGIKVDVLLGDFDRLGQKLDEIKKIQHPLEIIHTPDQDKTDLEKAFEFLIQRGHKAANVVWATGKRADHTISNITQLIKYKNQLQVVILDNHSRVFCLNSNFRKWYPAGTPISLIPVGTVNGITTNGLKYNLKDETLRLGHRSGNSNEVLEDGIISIEHIEGDLLLMECHD